MRLAQEPQSLASWKTETPGRIGLNDVISNANPTALIGTSGQPNAFTEKIVRDMTTRAARPIFFPLPNPTERSEATPMQIDEWSEGRAVIGTGSPFPPLKRDGKAFRVDQTTNAYVYPGTGLGA